MVPFLFVILVLFGTSSSWAAMSSKIAKTRNSHGPDILASRINSLAGMIGENGEITNQNFTRSAIGLNLALSDKDKVSLGRSLIMASDGSSERKVLKQLVRIPGLFDAHKIQIDSLTGMPVIVEYMLSGHRSHIKHFAKAYEECFKQPIDWNIQLEKPTIPVPEEVQNSLSRLYKKTPLQIAVSTHNPQDVNGLLQAGGQYLDMGVTDEFCLTPFHTLILKGYQWNNIGKEMIKLGADVNGSPLCSESPLVSAVVRDNNDMVDFLLSKNSHLTGAVLAAIKRAQPSMLSKLLKHIPQSGEAIDFKIDDHTILDCMTTLREDRYWERFNDDVRPQLDVHTLLKNVTSAGNNTFHLGVLFDRKENFWNSFTKEELASNIGIQNMFGETVLHMAVVARNIVALKRFKACNLLTAENINVRDIHEKTVIDYVLELGDSALIEMFKPFLSKNQRRRIQRQQEQESNQTISDQTETVGKEDAGVVTGRQSRARGQKLDASQLGFDGTRIVHEGPEVTVIRHNGHLWAYRHKKESDNDRVLPPLPPVKRYKDDEFHDVEALQKFVMEHGDSANEEYFNHFSGGRWDLNKCLVIKLEMARRPLHFNPQNFARLAPKEFREYAVEFAFRQDESGSFKGFHGMIRPNKALSQLKRRDNYLLNQY